MTEDSDIESSVTDNVEDTLRQEHADQIPSGAEREALLEDHEHHLVRETTSQVTVQDDRSSMVTIESTVELPDTYCFTCEEWVGLSGAELTGTPRSKADAFYLDGPPSGVRDVQDEIRETLADLAERAIDEVEHLETAEDALEFVGDQHEALTRAAEEVER